MTTSGEIRFVIAPSRSGSNSADDDDLTVSQALLPLGSSSEPTYRWIIDPARVWRHDNAGSLVVTPIMSNLSDRPEYEPARLRKGMIVSATVIPWSDAAIHSNKERLSNKSLHTDSETLERLKYTLDELSLIEEDAEELDFTKPRREIQDQTRRILCELYLSHSVHMDGDVCVMQDGSICIYFHGAQDSIVSIYCNGVASYCYSNIGENPNRGNFVNMNELPDAFTLGEMQKLAQLEDV